MSDGDLIRRGDARRVMLACASSYSAEEAVDAIAALPTVTPGVRVDIDELAYRFWSIHPKEIPEPIGMPEGYKGGRRAWFYATEMRNMIAALDLTTQPSSDVAGLVEAHEEQLGVWADELMSDLVLNGLMDLADHDYDTKVGARMTIIAALKAANQAKVPQAAALAAMEGKP